MAKIRTLRDFLADSSTISRLAVRWGEMDSFQHVNNTVFFKYQEVSRLQFLRLFVEKIDDPSFERENYVRGVGVGPIVSETNCKFKLPLTWPDRLLVSSKVFPADIAADRYKVTHRIWSMNHRRIASEGASTVVNYNYKLMKPQQLAASMRSSLDLINSHDCVHLLEKIESSFFSSEEDPTDDF